MKYPSAQFSALEFIIHVTKEQLNALPNVRIHQSKFQWYLNGELWTDSSKWTKIE